MKSFFLLATLTLSVAAFGQTPSVKWTLPKGTIEDQEYVQLNGQMYFYYIDSTKFVLYNQITSSTLSAKFQIDFPTGFGTSYGENEPGPIVYVIPDISGDGKDDIEFVGFTNSGPNLSSNFLLVDGTSGSILYMPSLPILVRQKGVR